MPAHKDWRCCCQGLHLNSVIRVEGSLNSPAFPERRGEGTGGKVHSAYSRIER